MLSSVTPGSLLLNSGTGKFGIWFCCQGKLEFMAELPCKVSACCASSPCRKPVIPRDCCWKWDCVKCNGLAVEEADLNHRLHPLLIAVMPFGPLFPSSGDTLPITLECHIHLRLWYRLWSLSEGSGSCAWCSPPFLDCPAHAGEGSSALLFWVCICSPGFLGSWAPRGMPWQSGGVPRLYWIGYVYG